MTPRVFISKRTSDLAALFTLAVLTLACSTAMAGGTLDDDARVPHASFEHSEATNFDSANTQWDTGIRAPVDAADDTDPLVVLERPTLLLDRDGFGVVSAMHQPAFRITDQSLSINMIRLGEALKAAAQWYRRPRKVAADAKLVVDSFYDFGKEVVDDGLVLIRSRSEQKGLQAKLGPTWMRGGPAARLKVSF